MNNSIIKYFFTFAFVSLLAACSATTYTVDQALVESFESKPVAEDRTGVYVIRGSAFQGSGRSLWVAVNDAVVASLSNGSHVYLTLESGLNTVHGVQGFAGFAHTTIDNLPGETVFVSIDYLMGTATILDPALGKTMVAKTKVLEPLAELRKNDALDNTLLTPGVLGLNLMVDSDQKLLPDAEHAVVTFYRTDKLIAQWPFDIWSQEGYLGSTVGNTYFQVKLKPGKHTFLSISEQYSLLEADLEANKEYAVELSVGMGWNQAHIKLLPVDLESDDKFLAKAEAAQLKAVDQSVIQSEVVARRLELGFELVEAALERRRNGELEARTLEEN